MTDTAKKTEVRRLLIYLGITFAISWIMFFSALLPGNSFLDESGNLSGIGNLICTFGMLCPAIGVIITRFITKEGYALTGENSLMLGISLKNGRFIFYILAVLLPWIYTEAGHLLIIALKPGAFDREYFRAVTGDVRNAYMFPLMAIVSGAFISIGGLGEELGWRGYMMPKLVKLLGFTKAVIAGGIIWGIWHWPLTYAGHNFGKDYRGYPFAGFAAMCLLCIAMGILLTFVTLKTGSVWPAAIMHAVNNASPSIMQFFVNPEKTGVILGDRAVSFLVRFIPLFIISAVLLIVYAAGKKKNAPAHGRGAVKEII